MNELLPILRAYLDELHTVRANPQATGELSLRDALSKLLEASKMQFQSNVEFVGEGKKLAQGRPDYTLTRHHLPIGYIEAEKISSDLSKLSGHAKTQNEAFISDLDNFLLTNHLDFRLFSATKLVAQLVLPENSAQLDEAHARQWENLFAQLLAGEIQPIKNPSDLALVLARRAQMLQRAISEDLGDKGSFSSASFQEFKTQLLPNISPAEFADLYAQTLAYGLFAARCLVENEAEFSIESAARRLKTIPLLASLFREFEFHLSDKLEWILREMEVVLKKAPIASIRDYFEKRSGRADPMIDFYEPFLAAYNARQRELRGVYYTPEAVVSYIVRSVDALLKNALGRELGLAAEDVKILDPATGTGSFLFAVLDEIHTQLASYGVWQDDVQEKVLPRLLGLELMVAPYTIAHLKLGLQLESWETPPQNRLRIYLSNTLDDVRTTVRGNFELGREVEAADDIKAREEVLVVLGNPPYSGHSANLNYKDGDKKNLTAVGKRLETYKTVDGAPLGERNPKWLNDDYVKFIAFAQNRIAQTGEGIVAFITNHGYLDNPTFRGMRASLLDSFDAIYLLDLHGNAKKKEVAPDGGKDENVFDIQQGVAILLAVRKRGDKTERAQVFHAELWGRRDEKYTALNSQDVTKTAWQVLAPSAPHYLFVPRDEELLPEYERGMKVTEIFPVNGWGIATRKDYLLVDFDKQKLIDKFVDLKTLSAAEAIKKHKIKTSPHWNFEKSHQQLADNTAEQVRRLLFRPFDFRYVYYEKHMIERGDHRFDLMKNFFHENLGLITVRRVETTEPNHFFCTDDISVLHSTSAKEGNFVFPLYLYTNDLFGQQKQVNFAPKFIQELSEKLALPIENELPQGVSPEAIFGYIYAVLHSPTYRARYAQFLKTDFPRVPFPTSRAQFDELSALGAQLVALHTLDSQNAPQLNEARFPVRGDGNNEVERAHYDEAAQWLRFNATRGFSGVPESVWNFKIGGYQVAKKWLDDRKTRTLSFADLKHFQKTLIALAETQRLMQEIDAIALI